MKRLHTPRRFTMTLATLALLTVPFGCGTSDTPASTSADVPTPPAAVADAPPADPGAGPTPMAPGTGLEPPTVDQVRQKTVEPRPTATQDAAEARKDVREAEGDVKKAVEDAEGEAKQKARAVEAEARKAADEALDKLLPSPK